MASAPDRPPPHPLDRWLGHWQFEEVHALRIRATPAACLDAAEAVDPAGDALIQAAMALREAPGRLTEALGRAGALRQRPRFGLQDFVALGRDGDRSLCHGLVGAFWRLGYGLCPQASAAAFARFEAPGVAKLGLSFHTEPDGPGHTRLVTTTRVMCPDADSLRRFRAYWWLIRPVSGLIRRRLLQRIRQVAEQAGG
jgi:hypothetical protein